MVLGGKVDDGIVPGDNALKQPNVTDNLNIQAKINSFNSLSTIDKNNFTITADLDGQQK